MSQRATTSSMFMSRTNRGSWLAGSTIAFVAAFGGVAVGVITSLAVVMPMVHAELATQSKALDQKFVSMVPAGGLNACVGSTVPPSAQVLGASVGQPAGGRGSVVGSPSGSSGGPQTFVTKLVKGTFQKSPATIENTGPSSVNKVIESNTTTTTVTNTNNISAASNNSQKATSGTATVNENTAAASATGGDASNGNTTDLKINVTNE